MRIRILSDDHAAGEPAPVLSEAALTYVEASNDWRGDLAFGSNIAHIRIWYLETGEPSNPCTWQRFFDVECLQTAFRGFVFDTTNCDPFRLTVHFPAAAVSPCGYTTENGVTVWIDYGSD
jgi:hypothetical protein